MGRRTRVASPRLVLATQTAGTFAKDVASGILLLLLFRLIARTYGDAAFGDYQVVRAVATLAVPAVILGVGVVVARQIARADTRLADTEIMGAALLLTMPVAALLPVVALVAPGIGGAIGLDQSSLVLATALYVASFAFVSIVTPVLLGQRRLVEYNVMMFLPYSVAPLIGFALGDSVTGLLNVNSAIAAALALAWVVLVFRRADRPATRAGMRDAARLLGRYGPPRVVGDFSYLGLLAVPTLVAAAQEDAVVAGAVGLMTSAITIGLSLLQPLSVVLLPWASHSLSTDQGDDVRSTTQLLAGVVGVIGLVAALALIVAAPLVVAIIGYSSTELGVSIIRAAAFALPGMAIHMALRSQIEAADLRAINARNANIGMLALAASLAALTAAGVGNVRFGLALTAAGTVLGLLTTVSARRRALL